VLLEKFNILYDPVSHRLRCNGHIINLAAQALLFSKDEESLSIEQNANLSYLPTEHEMNSWRKKGPLGKLHNLVVYIQRSPQRMASFSILSQGKRLARDNQTRWNSWYYMIHQALLLRPAIDVFCAQTGQDLTADVLTNEDWVTLQHINQYLKFFHQATIATEGHYDTIEKVLSTMEFLLEKLEAAKVEFAGDSYMSPSINASWSKLDKYYSLTERSPAYIAAMVLTPSQKWTWIEDNWETEWITTAKTQLQQFWNTQYKPVQLVVVPTVESLTHEKTEHQLWLEKKRRQPPALDEYVKYCQAQITPEVNSKAWWMEPAQRVTYPNLGKMALDMLSIPAMSASPERLFSGASITITERRNRLGNESIEALECLKSWYKAEGSAWADD
jgi:hypothetical protein